MLWVVSPVFHRKLYGPVPPVGFAVNVADPPAQTDWAAEHETDRAGSIVTITEAVLVAVELPNVAVAVTVFVVAPAGGVTVRVHVSVAPGARVNEVPEGESTQFPEESKGEKSSAEFAGVPLSSTTVTVSVTVLVLWTVYV